MADSSSDSLQDRIAASVELVREVSMHTDPQEMVRQYTRRIGRLTPRDAAISLSRRDLQAPYYRITRYTGWVENINPWKQKDRLPVLKGGLLAELLYGNEPHLIGDLQIPTGEPAAEYLKGMRSLVALPLYERGESINMVIRLMRQADGFSLEHLPDLVVTSNLFGRATHNLVLAEERQQAYNALDAEFQTIADIQRSLLPPEVPKVRGLDVAAYYATSARAGGDYYDFFPLPGGRLGILVADVSGHGAAAAVVMARMHAALHAYPKRPDRPPEVLRFANEHLLLNCRTQLRTRSFVTAFYGVFEPESRSMEYSTAGHPPPRWHQKDRGIHLLDGAGQMPLGIECGLTFGQAQVRFERGESVLLYTDGITEAMNPQRELFGERRLDEAIARRHDSAEAMVGNVVGAVERFVECEPFMDDRTLLALCLR